MPRSPSPLLESWSITRPYAIGIKVQANFTNAVFDTMHFVGCLHVCSLDSNHLKCVLVDLRPGGSQYLYWSKFRRLLQRGSKLWKRYDVFSLLGIGAAKTFGIKVCVGNAVSKWYTLPFFSHFAHARWDGSGASYILCLYGVLMLWETSHKNEGAERLGHIDILLRLY